MSNALNKLAGKVALVSGSGRGIGREIALKLAREGAAVVINDLDEAPARQTVAEIEAAGGRALACVGSVTEAGFAERFVEAAVTDCFQPSAVGEVLRPAIKFGASLPCEIKSLAQATVAAGENAFYDTGY